MKGLIHLSYWLGILAAVLAFAYRGLWKLGLASAWPKATGVVPYNLLQLSFLLFVFCLATEVYARNRSGS